MDTGERDKKLERFDEVNKRFKAAGCNIFIFADDVNICCQDCPDD